MDPRLSELLQQVGQSRMSAVAYDTAWVARLGEIAPELSLRALDWLCEHQLPDGSWGAAQPYHYHDRLISTLAAMIALARHGRARAQIERGRLALESITENATRRLRSSGNATVGFELIVPTLVAEAEELGLIKRQSERILGQLSRLRAAKMARLDGRKINRYISSAFSAEMAGQDGRHILDIENLQEANGSVGCSPSATAYFAFNARSGDQRALAYLHNVVDPRGGAPDFSPIDVFEIGWTLWNLHLFAEIDKTLQTLYEPYLDILQRAWTPGVGIGIASSSTLKDGDDTGLVFEVLKFYGREPDIEAVLNYEEEHHFRCYALEADPSISTNVHVLGAFWRAGFEKDHPTVRKVLAFLHQMRQGDKYWSDKWHASPYYATAHAVILACHYDDNNICQEAVDWILGTQKTDGSWGFYGTSTAEETAYCLQALAIWRRHGGSAPAAAIKRAAAWLQEHGEPPYPPLWIGKGLYTPELVVRSAVLSALLLSEKG